MLCGHLDCYGSFNICYFLQSMKKEFDTLTKSLATAKKQLEEETIKRVDLENRVQSLKEELAFVSQVHQQVKYQN